MTTFDTLSTPLPRRLREGIDRLAAALKADQWAAAQAVGLNPTQAHVLTFLAGRNGGMRVKAIAGDLGVTQPTATDSVAALERKGLLEKRADAEDGRAVAVRVTSAGRAAVQAIGLTTMATEGALSMLAPADQAELLRLVVTLIRSLQDAGAIAPQRLCVTCRHFRPHAHHGEDLPHHCAFVDAAFGTRHLRLDCGEHESADPSHQAATWRRFTSEGPAALQTNT